MQWGGDNKICVLYKRTNFIFKGFYMKKLIIGLLALAIVFGFAGCKKDADESWKEAEAYINNADHKIYLSLSELEKAGETNYSIEKVFVLKNPGFKKLVDYKEFNLETGKMDYRWNEEYTLPNTMDDFFNENMGILNNKAIIWWTDAYLQRQTDSTHKAVYYFDDNSTLSLYADMR